MPPGSLLISVLRDGSGTVPTGDTVLEAGDEILAVLEASVEPAVTAFFGVPDDEL
jgi:Trk K+ transport system NAD-binding subunit